MSLCDFVKDITEPETLVDGLLGICTLGFWFIYISNKNKKEIHHLQKKVNDLENTIIKNQIDEYNKKLYPNFI